MFIRGCGAESKWMLEQILKNEISILNSALESSEQNILTKESSMSKHQSASSRIEQTEPVDFSSTPSIFGDTSGTLFGPLTSSPRNLDRLHTTGKKSFNLSSL